MIAQEEITAAADRLTDALSAAAAIMPPDETDALSSPVPSRLAPPASGPVRRRTGRLRAWLVPVGAAACVAAIILAAVNLAGHPRTDPAPGTGRVQAPGTGHGQAPAGAGSGITSLAGVPSDPGTRTPPPPFYVTIVSTGFSRSGDELMAVQVRRTSDGNLTGTMPALPAGWILARTVSVTADNRTVTVAAETLTVCPSSTPSRTRFYQFNVTRTGHVTGLRAVGKLIIGVPVSQFAASPDGTKVAYAQQGCPAAASPALNVGVIHVMNLASGAVRSWHSTVSAATPARVTTEIGAMSWTADGRTLAVEYLWQLPEGSLDLAVLGLDATSSGGSLQAHSRVLFSQNARCAVCVYTAVIGSGGSTLTLVAASPAPPPNHGTGPWFRLYVLRYSLATGRPSGILYRSDASNGTYNDGGLVPVLSADGQVQHWILWNDPEQFGWISGGNFVPLRPHAAVLADGW